MLSKEEPTNSGQENQAYLTWAPIFHFSSQTFKWWACLEQQRYQVALQMLPARLAFFSSICSNKRSTTSDYPCPAELFCESFLIRQLNRFFTWISVRASIWRLISCHLLPRSFHSFRILYSSSTVHLSRRTLGSMTLIQRSRHCLGLRWLPGPTALLNSSAILVHSLG